MGTSDKTKVYRIPGRLAHTPTNLGTAFPHGGTALGITSSVRLEYSIEYLENIDPEKGGHAEVIEGPATVRLYVMMRQWDNDTISKIFPHSAVGSSTNRIARYPGTIRPGRLLSGSAITPLIWTPNNATTHPTILLYKALPMLSQPFTLRMSAFSELALAVEFVGIRDASSRVFDMGLLSDLSL